MRESLSPDIYQPLNNRQKHRHPVVALFRSRRQLHPVQRLGTERLVLLRRLVRPVLRQVHLVMGVRVALEVSDQVSGVALLRVRAAQQRIAPGALIEVVLHEILESAELAGSRQRPAHLRYQVRHLSVTALLNTKLLLQEVKVVPFETSRLPWAPF